MVNRNLICNASCEDYRILAGYNWALGVNQCFARFWGVQAAFQAFAVPSHMQIQNLQDIAARDLALDF